MIINSNLVLTVRTVFIFPIKNVSQSMKDDLVLTFASEVFGVKEPDKSLKTVKMLERLVSRKKTNNSDINQLSDSGFDSSIDSSLDISSCDLNQSSNLELGNGRFCDIHLAESTPGPKLSKLTGDCHTDEDSLRVIYYLGNYYFLSKKCEFRYDISKCRNEKMFYAPSKNNETNLFKLESRLGLVHIKQTFPISLKIINSTKNNKTPPWKIP